MTCNDWFNQRSNLWRWKAVYDELEVQGFGCLDQANTNYWQAGVRSTQEIGILISDGVLSYDKVVSSVELVTYGILLLYLMPFLWSFGYKTLKLRLRSSSDRWQIDRCWYFTEITELVNTKQTQHQLAGASVSHHLCENFDNKLKKRHLEFC